VTSDSHLDPEKRFAEVFSYLGMVVAYAARRGVVDPEGLGAEVMLTAWRRLPDIPPGDPKPWLLATARLSVLADRRRNRPAEAFDEQTIGVQVTTVEPMIGLDPELEQALLRLSDADRESILLIAWEDLTPRQAALSLGVTATAFRVRLHRARRRLERELAASSTEDRAGERRPTLEGT
jgi:RNA polymerase sigma-70 factor (ECF subfamily)